MWLLTILYEGLALCSMLAPTETIITGPTELTPAKDLDSSRFWSEENNSALVKTLFVTKIMLIGRTLLSHLSGYDSNHLCSFAL